MGDALLRDLTDDEARRALVCKWGSVDPDVLPAWVAEMDYALAPPVVAAVTAAVAAGMTGYPRFERGGALGEAYAAFARRHYGHQVDPGQVLPVVDVTSGVRLLLDVLSDPGPMVMPLPAYHPQLDIAQVTGRRRVDLVVDPDAARAELDLDRLDALLAAGARTLLLTQPHNPWGRAFSRAELEGVRDVVVRHGARVISDEIHAPLVLPGAEHVPYLSLDGTAEHAVAVVAASKAFNTAGLRCAQIVTADPATLERLLRAPMARNDSWSPLGVVAAVAAYTDGDPWLAALVDRLAAQRELLTALLAEHLPEARMRPLEATYLAWLDLRAYGYADPAARVLERGRVKTAPGHHYHPGLTGHLRLNIATSPQRLTEIVRRMADALVTEPEPAPR
ncbi:MAG TPA: aminotransferase class I/II-fold pyridoxal phosphate-dependent enzyme [Nocardioides sp.]|uniref:MalY/PatB family protein n=1 Tax=Nocardioides sp. TaxID=35761 RepID=UPI002CF23F92|nr:aminotransferase class I/II-fold pyridoxal phosphate-dependent enzyme [Nocardioides sp.]HQR28416.1 aminotransferase class I/II-fold pyridoxal phosphate-dependent enzyme [Nocardioides sp.]